jgi:uncharacterized protein YjiK
MLFQRGCLPTRLAIFVCTLTLYSACAHKSYSSPQGYDLSKPQLWELGKILMEISGICYNDENNTLLAISDSKKQVFEINYRNIKLKDFTDKVVPAESDLEDIAKVGDQLFLLSSRGAITEVNANATARDSNSVKVYELPQPGKNDFETIYYDPTVKGLVILCKSCAFEKGQHTRSAFRFDLETRRFDTSAFFNISTEDVKKLLKDDNAKFDPSAAAIHPVDKRLYILSSAGTLMVVADTRGKVIEAYNLNPDKFPQAEGIAFAPNGEMFISNEGKYGKPTLSIFPFNQNVKKK